MIHPHRPKTKAESHLGHRYLERRRLLWAMVLTAAMMVVECLAGILTHSVALLSDAGHMLSHFFALAVSFAAILIAGRPHPKEKSYGFFRAEILAALVNGVFLLGLVVLLFVQALDRFVHPQPILGFQMFLVAAAGLAVNLITAAILHEVSQEDLNVKSAFLHMLGDTASSVGVVAAAVIILFTKWLWVDPAVSMFINGVILIWSLGLIRESVHVLLESTPRHIDLHELIESLRKEVPEVEEVHELHIWEITSKMYAMTAHVKIQDRSLQSAQSIVERIGHFLNRRYEIEHTTIQLEVK